ncbi:calcium-binding protein [Vandammella animalimorsus]|nr:calcium-binding protein [Vandammella animalimorsus]
MATLNNQIKNKLEKFIFECQSTAGCGLSKNTPEEIINEIEKSQTLVELLNKYSGNFSNQGRGADYDGKEKIIRIDSLYDKDRFISALSHELGHALGKYQADWDVNGNEISYRNSNAETYSNARARGEGEAAYYEAIVSLELGKPLYTEIHYKNIRQIILDGDGKIIKPLTEEMANTIGSQNFDLRPSGINNSLTYDQVNKAWFLRAYTNLAKDYEQATGMPLTRIDPATGQPYYTNPHHIASLTDRAHGFVNVKYSDKLNSPNDELRNNFPGGTKNGQQDVLYGGKGNDTLHGNSGDDILIGGSDNDQLYGNNGKDILSGSAGRDVMHGGDGFDTYRADREDTIKDSDGLGEVYLDGARLEGGVRANDRQQKYISADGKTTYELENDGTLKVNGDKQGKGLTIQDFKNGDLGIDLKEQEAPVQKSSQSPVSSLSHLATMVLNGNREDRDAMGRQIASSPLGEQFRQRGEELQQAHREEQLALQQQQMQEAREQQEAQVRRGPVMH